MSRVTNEQHARNLAEVEIQKLAMEIAKQRSPYSTLATAASPHEIARALYLLGWQPPRTTDPTNGDQS